MGPAFTGEIEVNIVRAGRQITTVKRPLHNTIHGPVIRFRRKLWRVEGTVVNLDNGPVDDDTQPVFSGSPDNSEQAKEDDGSLQADIINAPAQARLFVDAGPGTGKTFVACSRIASLINDGIPASRIWMISFTRTAIYEIRGRLATYLSDPSDAVAVKIATLDSHAWSMQSGFNTDAKLTGSFDNNIEATLTMIRKDADLQNELLRVRHLIVDEAQDIVGLRSTLVLEIIDRLDEECGVTVFADRAQAIYGFTEDSRITTTGTAFVDDLDRRAFTTAHLIKVHRTADPGLLRIFTDVRKQVLDRSIPADRRSESVREEIRKLASASVGTVKGLDLSGMPDGSLVLLRQRFDVLQLSADNTDTPHRLRMSGLPPRIYPWLENIFWDFTDRRIDQDTFSDRWATRIPAAAGRHTCADAWRLMVEAAGETASLVDVHRLRSILGRANPPAVFTSPEYGDVGPVIGTIHASKGREAEDVRLYLPPQEEMAGENADEEIRVLFVGATRAKNRLAVGDSPGRQSGNSDGRVWKRLAGGKLMIEIGRTHDLVADGLVGTACFSEAEALGAQRRIRDTSIMAGLYARAIRELDWRLALSADEQRIAVFGDKLKSDLREIARECKRWPQPGYLAHVRSTGHRTMVLRPDDPELERLHEPWRSSGFLLAPMITGFGWSKLGGKS